MALKINRPLGNTGVVANYCRIVNFKPDVPSLSVEILLAVFLNKEIRDTAGSAPLMHEKVILENKSVVGAMFMGPVDANLSLYNNVATALYAAIKQLPEWSEAEDV